MSRGGGQTQGLKSGVRPGGGTLWIRPVQPPARIHFA